MTKNANIFLSSWLYDESFWALTRVGNTLICWPVRYEMHHQDIFFILHNWYSNLSNPNILTSLKDIPIAFNFLAECWFWILFLQLKSLNIIRNKSYLIQDHNQLDLQPDFKFIIIKLSCSLSTSQRMYITLAYVYVITPRGTRALFMETNIDGFEEDCIISSPLLAHWRYFL